LGSSCGSTPLDENEGNCNVSGGFSVDSINEPTPRKLYGPQEYFPLKVALGQAWYVIQEGQLLHGAEIPRGYAKVSIDSIVKRRYTMLLGHPPEEDNKTHLVGTGAGPLWCGANTTNNLVIMIPLWMKRAITAVVP
jgi:hypothetical protein